MTATTLATLSCALVFALVHVLTPRMRFLEGVPRSRWLSFAGGVAVAYVFLHILPELAEHERTVEESRRGAGELVYAMSLLGLALFYGLERMVRGRAGGTAVFRIHIGSFSLYNVLIGYLLLHREEQGAAGLALFALAMALHFLTNDFGLRQDHRALYDRQARWVLAAAVLAGWLLGLAIEVPEAALLGLFSFLAGGVVLNVLKEELPEERQSRFGAFALGAFGYGAVLALI